MNRRTILQLAAMMPFAGFQNPSPKAGEEDWSKLLKKFHKGEVLEGTVVTIDNESWSACTFKGCVIRYGGGPTQLLNNEFHSCSFAYFDCAERTIAFAQLMNQQLGPKQQGKAIPQMQEMNNRVREQ